MTQAVRCGRPPDDDVTLVAITANTRPTTIVVGGGLAGTTTAHRLCQQGHDVTLLEADAGLGEGASFANGTMLTASMAEPWNAPGVATILAKSLFDAASPMKLRLNAPPSLAT